MVNLNEAKLYLRIDGNDEDSLIQSLITRAFQYMKNAVDNYEALYETAGEDWQELARQAELLLIYEWYENREAKTRPPSSKFQLILIQLQMDGLKYEQQN